MELAGSLVDGIFRVGGLGASVNRPRLSSWAARGDVHLGACERGPTLPVDGLSPWPVCGVLCGRAPVLPQDSAGRVASATVCSPNRPVLRPGTGRGGRARHRSAEADSVFEPS
jgi:hypothetical protein